MQISINRCLRFSLTKDKRECCLISYVMKGVLVASHHQPLSQSVYCRGVTDTDFLPVDSL